MNTITALFSSLLVQAQAAPAAAGASASVPAAQRVLHQNLTWSEVMQFLFVGLTIVFMTLILLWVICEIMGLIFKKLDAAQAARLSAEKAVSAGKKTEALAAAPAAPAPAAPAPAAGTAASEESIPPAVFVAAAAAMMGNTPCRVISVQKLSGDSVPLSFSENIPLAVIAAAVAEVMQGAPHRILSVKPVDMSWAFEGRRQQMQQ